jgi:glycerol-3-phosphate acyltransferase PlsY
VTDALAVGLGFLLGSIPCSWLLVRWRTGKDLASEGSGNVGALNSMRVARSPALGAFALALDLLKGLAAVLLARALGVERSVQLATAVAAVAGHAFNPWLSWLRGRLSGGKGFATAAGAFLPLTPWLVLVWIGVGVVAWVLFRLARGIRDEAPASAVAALSLPPAAQLLYERPEVWAMVALASIMLAKLVREVRAVLRRA